MEEKKKASMRTKTRERSKLYDKSCHSSGKRFFCLSAQPEEAGSEAGRAAIAFHWQADKQGAAWRQEGHYQRLGQTEIRASFGPGRQASTHTHKPWKLHRGKTVKPGMSRFALWKCQL